ncbi:MAG: hypothetical protein GX124_07820 [Clostridiales bacterium]|nr:hypothetical protein [Clostridiales bacterium]
MSENRARYSSAPLRDMNRRPKTQSTTRPPAQHMGQPAKARSFPVLQVTLIMVLPILFVVSLLAKDTRLYWVFVVASLLNLLAMALLRAFVPNARKVLAVVHAAMIAVVLFALLVSTPPPPADTLQQAQSLQSIFNENSSASMVDMAQSQAQAQPEPTENPGSASQAQQKLEQFMSAWMNTDYAGMVSLSLPNWVNQHESAGEAEKSMFHLRANRSVLDYQIIDVSGSDGDQARTITMQASVSKNNGESPLQYNFQILLMRVNNVWYVDPNSISSSQVTNALAQQQQMSQAQQEQAIAQVQAPVAPQVSPDTILYYNADGGKYYHADPNCSSIGAQYRPLTAMFYYRDVSSTKLKNLIPCPICNAPAR